MNPFTLLLSSPLWIALLFFPGRPQAATMPATADTLKTTSAPESGTRTVTPSNADSEKLNINQASAQALAEGLNGVGLEKARAIVAFREQHGPFSHLEQLLQVKGIGAALLEKNRARLAF